MLDRGLSPRGRGKRAFPVECRDGGGSIPAWAGETLQQEINAILMKVYPRVGGGNDFGVEHRVSQ